MFQIACKKSKSLLIVHRTIGKLEPSYVIRKFLDAQRIHNLTAYLQALHRQSLANEDHTTLLLNCYTKLKDSSKLEEFIKVTIAPSSSSFPIPARPMPESRNPFTLNCVIQMLRIS